MSSFTISNRNLWQCYIHRNIILNLFTISYHKWEIVISDSITNIHKSWNVCVASVEGVETWPKMTLQGSNSSCDITLDAPWVLWEVFWYIIKAVWMVDGFTSSNQTFNFWILWLTAELPVGTIESLFFCKTHKGFVWFYFFTWGVFDKAFWHSINIFDLAYNIGKSI